MREVVAIPTSPRSREIRTTVSSIVAAAGLALRYPAFCRDSSTAWRRLSAATSAFLELVTSVTARRSRSAAGAGEGPCAAILSDRAAAAQPATATRRMMSGIFRGLLKKAVCMAPLLSLGSEGLAIRAPYEGILRDRHSCTGFGWIPIGVRKEEREAGSRQWGGDSHSTGSDLGRQRSLLKGSASLRWVVHFTARQSSRHW